MVISAVGIGGVNTVNTVNPVTVVTQDMGSGALTTTNRRKTAMENRAEIFLEVIMTELFSQQF